MHHYGVYTQLFLYDSHVNMIYLRTATKSQHRRGVVVVLLFGVRMPFLTLFNVFSRKNYLRCSKSSENY